MRYAGVMTGTSMDAIDVAIIGIDASNHNTIHLLGFESVPFEPSLAQRLAQLQSPGINELDESAGASVELAHAISRAVQLCLKQCGLKAADVTALGVHGQTVRHCPERGYSIQLNNPAMIAERTGITVVSDFRSRDIAAGGQGAPLVPAFHQAVFGKANEPAAIINIGGMANITWLGSAVYGHDTGPGNVLLDHMAHLHLGQPFDRDGVWAKTGAANPGLLHHLLREPFFAKPAPKSTGRDLFNAGWLESQLTNFCSSDLQNVDSSASQKNLTTLAPQDIQATLLELTAITIANEVATLANHEKEKSSPMRVWICGGGARNAWLVQRLEDQIKKKVSVPIEFSTTDAAGWPAQTIEAAAFAWLARQAMQQQPGNIPNVTGAKGLRVLGSITPA